MEDGTYKMSDRDDKARQLIIDYRETFGSEHGKRVLEHLAENGYERKATYSGEETHRAAYREGMRCVILHIRAQLAKNPHEPKQEKAKE